MKKQIRLTLLFVLTVTLLLGVLAAIPFSAFADEDPQDTYTLTVKAVDEAGNLVQKYGEIKVTNGGTSDLSENMYIGSMGTNITLTVKPNEHYTFVGWMDNLESDYMLAVTEEVTLTIGAQDKTYYAVFEPTKYKIYYVGATGTLDEIPAAVQAKYETDPELHPGYLKPKSTIEHKYGTATVLPEAVYTKPLAETQTHTFLKWKAYNPVGLDITLEENTIPATIDTDIYLIPEWEPLQFTVTRIDRIGTPENYEETELGRYEELRNYGASVSGKSFGEVVEYTGYRFNEFNANLYTEAIVGLSGAVIYRYYTPCDYLVTFDVNAPVADAVTVRGIEELVATYKKAIPAMITVPKCTGYQFMGYYYVTEENEEIREIRYYDASGRLDEQITAWEIPNAVTLVAKWEIQKHSVVIQVLDQNGKDCSDAVKILINGTESFEPMDYGTQGYVRITVLSGQKRKITKWNGEVIPHTDSATLPFSIEEDDVKITVQLLPVEETPILKADYKNETLSGFLPGTYQIEADGIPMEITVDTDGKIEMTGTARSEVLSISDLFGKTLIIIRPGVEDRTADSDVQELKLQARPAAVPKEKISCLVTETKQSREFSFTVENGSGTVYEIGYTTANQELPKNWTTDMTLTGMEAGKTYTVWLRVRATESAPHGEATRVVNAFEFSHLIDLKPLFFILLFVFILQGAALAFLLIGRNRATTNAVSAPLLAILAIKLIPGGLFPWIVILTIAVVAMQVVLVYLALKSKVVWKKNGDGKKRSEGNGNSSSDSEPFELFGEERKSSNRAEEADRNENQD